MKNKFFKGGIFIFIILLSLLTQKIFGQRDSSKLNVYYDLQVKDSSEESTERFILSIGNSLAVFKSFDRYISDSTYGDGIQKITTSNTLTIKALDPRAYKNTTTEICELLGKSVFLISDELVMNKYRMIDSIKDISWQIYSDTQTINGLSTQKAIANFKGRTYEAWFSSSIPYPFGPWKLKGLPGLIVKASDTKSEFTFILTKIELGESVPNRKYISSNSSSKTITKKQYIDAYISMKEDPARFLEAEFNFKIVSAGGENLPKKKIFLPKLYRLEKE